MRYLSFRSEALSGKSTGEIYGDIGAISQARYREI